MNNSELEFVSFCVEKYGSDALTKGDGISSKMFFLLPERREYNYDFSETSRTHKC